MAFWKIFYLAVFIISGFQLVDSYKVNSYFVREEKAGNDFCDKSKLNNIYEIKKECTKPGLLCQTCCSLVNCIQLDDGSFDSIPLDICTGNNTCLVDQFTDEPNQWCIKDLPDFVCTATGIFPDPYDCQVFHLCGENKQSGEGQKSEIRATYKDPDTYKCDGNYGYDMVSTFCKKKLTAGCPSTLPVPQCTKLGQMGALENPSFYYMCLSKDSKLYPQLYLCSHGTRFVNGKCTA